MLYEDYAALRRTRSLMINRAEKAAQEDSHSPPGSLNLQEIDRSLSALEKELSLSAELTDKIYYLKYIGGKRPSAIAERLQIAEATVYRYLRIIREKYTENTK